MASSTPNDPSDLLTPLQRDLLRAFFARETGFFLTGGAALAGYHLKHRETTDLDLFTLRRDDFERGRFLLAEAVSDLGARMESRQEAPGFCRYIVARENESVVVDLVHEQVPQLDAKKETHGVVPLDSPQEIFANKLTTLVSRSEIRDVVDVCLLERWGCSLEEGLAVALDKDQACTPATLAWVLSQLKISADAPIPGGLDAPELSAYTDDLIRRLRRLAAPE